MLGGLPFFVSSGDELICVDCVREVNGEGGRRYPHVTLRSSISDGFTGRPIYYG